MMNNKMNEMMEAMMSKMMESMAEQMMTAMMNSMMNAMTPQVANAEATDKPKTATRARVTAEEYLANPDAFDIKETAKAVTKTDYSNLQMELVGMRMVQYNMPVNSTIWQYTDMMVRKAGGRCTKYQGQFYWIFDDTTESTAGTKRKLFLQTFKIKTEFTAQEEQAIKAYKKQKQVERAKRLLESEEQ